jgi:hypothetical protein
MKNMMEMNISLKVANFSNIGTAGGALKHLPLYGAAFLLQVLMIIATSCGQSGRPGGPGGNPPPDDSGPYTLSGTYTVNGGTPLNTSDQIYTSDTDDVSAVYVTHGGDLTLNNPMIMTSGNTSSQSNSSFYGLNAAVLATKAGKLTINGGTITTSGTGANGAISTDAGSTITLSNVRITATNNGGHGVMATNGGALTLNNVDMNTAGPHSAPIATDRGGGTITVTGGSVTSSGEGSPGIYATGVITATNLTSTATGSEAVVIEGKNTVMLIKSTLKGEKLCGIMIYQSFSGDAEVGVATYTMTGGALTAAAGPLFYVTNTNAEVTLTGVNTTAASGVLVRVSDGRWGTAGSNGGKLTFTADQQTLDGDIEVNNISTLTVTLQNGSTLSGTINSADTGKEVKLNLDATSSWNVTADSYLTCLTDTGGISGTSITNIHGNGFTVYYNKDTCPALKGQNYALAGGGVLKPTD